jgi:hypothetical protein
MEEKRSPRPIFFIFLHIFPEKGGTGMSQDVTEQAPAVFNEELGKESPDFNQGRNCRFSFSLRQQIYVSVRPQKIYI